MKEKLNRNLEKLLDGRLMTALLFAQSILLASFLGKKEAMYALPFFAVWWAIACLCWSLYKHRERRKWRVAIPFLAMLCWEALALIKRVDYVTLSALYVDILMVSVFLSGRKNKNTWLLALFVFGVLLYDLLCAWSVFGSDVSTRLGCQQGYNAEKKVLYGISINSNQLGALNLCGVFASSYLLAEYVPAQKNVKASLCAIVCMVFTGFMFLSYGRTSWLSFTVFVVLALIGCLFLRVHRPENGKKAMVLFFAILPVAVFLLCLLVYARLRSQSESVETFILNLFSSRSQNIYDRKIFGKTAVESHGLFANVFSSRLDLWQKALQLWRESPIYGVGQGNIRNGFITVFGKDATRPWEYLHNGFLQVLVANGTPAFIFFGIGMCTVFVYGIVKLFRYWDYKSLLLLSAMAAIMVFNLFEGAIFIEIKCVNVLFWLFAGILCSSRERKRGTEERKE